MPVTGSDVNSDLIRDNNVVVDAPRPAAGSRSRENSTRHGLSGAGVVMPETLRIVLDRRRVEYVAQYDPQDRRDWDLIELAALGFARFEEAQSLQQNRARLRAETAVNQWPLLRTSDTRERVKRLPTAPDRVVADLTLSLGGVEWMLQEWRYLLFAIEKIGDWTPAQADRARDLAGVPRIHRHLDPQRTHGGSIDDRKALVLKQIHMLEELMNDSDLIHRDAVIRQEIIDGAGLSHDPGLDRLSLYERRALRMYEKAIRELQERLDARTTTTSTESGTGGADARSSVVPPFASELDPDEYRRAIDDPRAIALVELDEIFRLPESYPTRMENWLVDKGLNHEVEDALRGVIGRLRQIGAIAPLATTTTTVGKSAPSPGTTTTTPAEPARTAEPARIEPSRDDRREFDRRSRKRHR